MRSRRGWLRYDLRRYRDLWHSGIDFALHPECGDEHFASGRSVVLLSDASMMNEQAERRIGTIIAGKWRVDDLLGVGSMASVFAVTHRNGSRAAFKILHATLCADAAVCERFLGEGYLANSIRHPGVVRVLDDGVTDDGCVFLVMDLLEGDTLETFRQARGGRIPLVEVLDVADRLMDIVSAVHAGGIIHRDLKPQNVFLCGDGTVKLFDFGVARVFDRVAQSKLSMFGLVLGTPSFMSPEQAMGVREKIDYRTDIWSLGATLFTALTGETVHLGANVQKKLMAAATAKARSIQLVMPDLPAPLGQVIDMALAFRKEDRWQSVDAMRQEIRDVRRRLGLAPPPTADFAPGLVPGVGNSSRPPQARAATSEPVHGPDGTFIGIGSGAGTVTGTVGNDGSVPPPNDERSDERAAKALAEDSHRPAFGVVETRSLGSAEGALPPLLGDAASLATLGAAWGPGGGLVDSVKRRSAGPAVWAGVVVVAALVLGGVALIATQRGGSLTLPSGVTSPPPGPAASPVAAPTLGATMTTAGGERQPEMRVEGPAATATATATATRSVERSEPPPLVVQDPAPAGQTSSRKPDKARPLVVVPKGRVLRLPAQGRPATVLVPTNPPSQGSPELPPSPALTPAGAEKAPAPGENDPFTGQSPGASSPDVVAPKVPQPVPSAPSAEPPSPPASNPLDRTPRGSISSDVPPSAP